MSKMNKAHHPLQILRANLLLSRYNVIKLLIIAIVVLVVIIIIIVVVVVVLLLLLLLARQVYCVVRLTGATRRNTCVKFRIQKYARTTRRCGHPAPVQSARAHACVSFFISRFEFLFYVFFFHNIISFFNTSRRTLFFEEKIRSVITLLSAPGRQRREYGLLF